MAEQERHRIVLASPADLETATDAEMDAWAARVIDSMRPGRETTHREK